MVKNNQNIRERDSQKAWIVKQVSEIHGVSESYVYMVIGGDRENEAILECYMELLERSNEMVEAVKKLVPFPTNSKKAATV